MSWENLEGDIKEIFNELELQGRKRVHFEDEDISDRIANWLSNHGRALKVKDGFWVNSQLWAVPKPPLDGRFARRLYDMEISCKKEALIKKLKVCERRATELANATFKKDVSMWDVAARLEKWMRPPLRIVGNV